LSLAGPEQQQELWTNVINKTTGQPYKTIWNCASIQRFEKEEPELAKKLIAAFEEWYKNDANKQLLKWDANNKDGCGFKYADGEFEYKLLEFSKDGKSWRTLGKRKVNAGGKGGYSNRPFTLLRTVNVQLVRLEQLSSILNTQGESDNYEVEYIKTDEQGDLFMLEKKESYTPQAVTTTAATKVDNNSEEGTTEENAS